MRRRGQQTQNTPIKCTHKREGVGLLWQQFYMSRVASVTGSLRESDLRGKEGEDEEEGGALLWGMVPAGLHYSYHLWRAIPGSRHPVALRQLGGGEGEGSL